MIYLINLSIENQIEISAIHIPKLNSIVLSVYRPPASSIKTFFQQFELVLKKLTQNSKLTLFIGGDFNINILNTKEKIVVEFLDLLASYNLAQTCYEPTRLKTCIDNIITSKNLASMSAVNKTSLSDHDGVYLSTTL